MLTNLRTRTEALESLHPDGRPHFHQPFFMADGRIPNSPHRQNDELNSKSYNTSAQPIPESLNLRNCPYQNLHLASLSNRTLLTATEGPQGFPPHQRRS